MANTVRKLIPAQDEMRQAAHDQDLVEVPRRAQLDRVAENRKVMQEIDNGIALTTLPRVE